jgi:hypothetical protein
LGAEERLLEELEGLEAGVELEDDFEPPPVAELEGDEELEVEVLEV